MALNVPAFPHASEDYSPIHIDQFTALKSQNIV